MKILNERFGEFEHIIWDWNGTLLADIDIAVETNNLLLREENLREITPEIYRQIFRFPVVDYYREIGFDVAPEKYKNLCERFNTLFYERLKNCDLWPGARELLQMVKDSGRKQSVLSATEQGLLETALEAFGLLPYFDHVYGIRDKQAGSKIYRGHELMAMAGVEPKRTVLIGDTDHDLEVGKALGIEVILVEHGHQHPDRLKRLHSKVVKIF